MASGSTAGSWLPGSRPSTAGFEWVSQAPSPADVQRMQALFPEVIKIPVSELEVEVADWSEKALIVRTFNRWLPADAFLREFRRAGVSGTIAPVSLAFRCHVFRFASKEDRELVLQRPWVINGQVVGVEAWRPEFFPAEDSVSTVMLWIRLPQLPLEYWKEDFLRAFVEPAGEFVCLDAATLAKSRGGFARVCIRADLRRPLRPGTWIQGSSQPFWQSFVFENFEGLCFKCGTLHLEGPCSLPGGDVEGCSGSDSAYGPWLVAIRKRRAALDPQVVDKGKAPLMGAPAATFSGSAPQTARSGPLPGSGLPSDGWVAPAKAARRRSSVSSKKKSSPAAVVFSSVEENGLNSNANSPVPVSAGRAVSKAPVQQVKSNVQMKPVQNDLNPSIELMNPFSSLASEGNVDRIMAISEGSPGPLKRARPEASLPLRCCSKPDKRKGKGKVSISEKGEVSCLIPDLQDQGPGFQFGSQEVVGAQSVVGTGLPLVVPNDDHQDQGQYALSQAQPVSMEEADFNPDGLSVNPLLMSEEGSQVNENLVDCVMAEDQGEVPSSSSL